MLTNLKWFFLTVWNIKYILILIYWYIEICDVSENKFIIFFLS